MKNKYTTSLQISAEAMNYTSDRMNSSRGIGSTLPVLRNKDKSKWVDTFTARAKETFVSTSIEELKLGGGNEKISRFNFKPSFYKKQKYLENNHLYFVKKSLIKAVADNRLLLGHLRRKRQNCTALNCTALHCTALNCTASKSKRGNLLAYQEPTKVEGVLLRREFKSSWNRNHRCEYCNDYGGELYCVLCNVIAHKDCYQRELEVLKEKRSALVHKETEKVKHCLEADFDGYLENTNFVTNSGSWMCYDCLIGLDREYVSSIVEERKVNIHQVKAKSCRIISAFIKMKLLRQQFQLLRRCAIRVQTMLRGKLARMRYSRLQRQHVRPFYIDMMQMEGFMEQMQNRCRTKKTPSWKPFVVISIVNADHDRIQYYNFETQGCVNPISSVSILDSKRTKYTENTSSYFLPALTVMQHLKGASTQETKADTTFFVPGVHGNINIVFTILNEIGPNKHLLGQCILKCSNPNIWHDGLEEELEIGNDLEIVPNRNTSGEGIGKKSKKSKCMQIVEKSQQQIALSPLQDIHLRIRLRPIHPLSTNCGYLELRNSLSSVTGQQRWCVLTHTTFRMFRHYGLNAANDTLDINLAYQISIVPCGKLKSRQDCIVVDFQTKIYILYCKIPQEQAVWMRRFEYVRSQSNHPTLENTNQPAIVHEEPRQNQTVRASAIISTMCSSVRTTTASTDKFLRDMINGES